MEHQESSKSILSQIASAFEEPSIPSFEMDLTQNIQEPQYLLQVCGVPTLPMGDISCIGGKAKAGKSYLVSIFVSALLSKDCMDIKSLIDDAKACLYDTEQHQSNVMRVCRRIHHLCGWDVHKNNPRFKAFTLRTLEPEARFRYIVDSIKKEKPQLAVIDGIVDLVRDFNSLEETAKCTNTLMALAVECNCHILSVLHQNQKSKDNQALRGHLGTSVVNKSSDIFTIERDNTIFAIMHDVSRNKTANDWCFTLDTDGMPVPMDAPISKEESAVNEIQDKLRKALADAPLRYCDLVSKYSVLKGCCERTSRRHIALAIQNDFIKETNGMYALRLRTEDTQGTNEDKSPF